MDQSILENVPAGIRARLAGKVAKQQSAAEAAAVAEISKCMCEIFALDDIARRFHRLPITSITLQELVSALCNGSLARVKHCFDALPMDHKAKIPLAALMDAMNSLKSFMEVFQQDGNEDGHNDGAIDRRVAGTSILAFVYRIAVRLSDAEHALGEKVSSVESSSYPSCNDPNRSPIQEKRKPARYRNKQRTAQDGQMLFIALLKKIEKEATSENMCSSPLYRDKGEPQNNIASAFLQILRDGCTPECWEGFASILTDILWTTLHSGSPDVSVYEDRARRGEFDGNAPGLGLE